MTNERLKGVVALYLERWGKVYPPKRMDTEAFFGDRNTIMAHAMWMCEEALVFIREERFEKANLWLGFVQGLLFCVGHYTIDEMRAHSTEPTEP